MESKDNEMESKDNEIDLKVNDNYYRILNLNENGEVSDITIFLNSSENTVEGEDITNEYYNTLFTNSPEHEVFDEIFSPEDKRSILESKTPVKFEINNIIFNDDSIETIKRKILMSVFNDQEKCIEELYLFAKQDEEINIVSIYQSLTQNDTKTITKKQLIGLLLNYNNLVDIPNKNEPLSPGVTATSTLYKSSPSTFILLILHIVPLIISPLAMVKN